MKVLKISGVIFGAIIVTALGIDASDTLGGSSGTLLGQLLSATEELCPSGMIYIPSGRTFTCVDVFENSPGEDCPIERPQNSMETESNIGVALCEPASVSDVEPWRFIAREDAQIACLRAGKRLPTNEEWQHVAAGTPEAATICNTAKGGVLRTGSHKDCKSASGVFDAVGNLWEWTYSDVIDGLYEGRQLPKEGYVLQVDTGGIATESGDAPSLQYGSDYIWTKPEGSYAILRGGFYGSREDAGTYAAHAATAPGVTGAGIGFRCVQ